MLRGFADAALRWRRSLGWRRIAAVPLAAARRFVADQCLTRASALAYTSLLSLVPLLALMFAVLKGLGVQHRLEPLLLSRLSLDKETTDAIIGYIDHTNVRTLGALGAAALVLTVLSVLGTIEASFNHIWRVARPRSLWRKVTDYLGVVLLTPLLLLAAVAITSSLQVRQVFDWVVQTGYAGGALMEGLRLAPIAINAVAIGILYAIMPNRRPYAPAVVLGAVAAGAAWHVVQWSYVTLQVGVARYSAIYGALAQLPVTLVWLYVSWAVVLAGAELAAVCEFGTAETGGDRASRTAVALHLLVRAAEAFRRSAPVDAAAVSRELRVDPEAVSEAAGTLLDLGWLAAVEGPRPRYVLARPPDGIEIAALDGAADQPVPPPCCAPEVRRAMEAVSQAGRGAWAGWRLSDLMRGSETDSGAVGEHDAGGRKGPP